MMQMTTAAFQAVVNLNQQATDLKAIPSSENFSTSFPPVPLLAKF
jgi:hypothetical protein